MCMVSLSFGCVTWSETLIIVTLEGIRYGSWRLITHVPRSRLLQGAASPSWRVGLSIQEGLVLPGIQAEYKFRAKIYIYALRQREQDRQIEKEGNELAL